jgi:hypothetical protein
MIRRHRLTALASVLALALALGACSQNDAKESDVVNAMTDANLNEEQADCIGEGINDAFSDNQDLYNDVAGAADIEDLPEGTESTIQEVLDECLGETPTSEGDTTSTTTAGADAGDTTTTTAASGG